MASGKKDPVGETRAKTIAAKAAPAKEKKDAMSAKREPDAKPPSRRSVALPASGKDPKGGLTAEGRKVYNDATGGHLRKGVQGEADTPEKMLRKGSFLRRHFGNPPGPVVDGKGEPTRQALQAAAWGEPVPKSEADEKKLAEKGSELLEQYHKAKGDAPKKLSKAGKGQAKGASSKD